ncbi:hypothetical protein M3T53_02035 [Actinomyces sp. B33]|uniref:hypothetical protein n=1 Tax=Actinomyces sp. B33 TaxID=2942131 RepID=UPI002341623D|nr:hypothetical protein [Actinomyces sp. B33]MDC4232496.1 hypothetical protein [Actinomyces sp. B33]
MELTIGTTSTRATIQLLGAMTTAVFEAGTAREFSPLYTAGWSGFPQVPLLDRLRGDFLCVPFGAAPDTAEALPEPWRTGYAGPGRWVHGLSSNAPWEVVAHDGDRAVLRLDYDDDSPVARVERTVSCAEGAVEFVDAIVMRADARLPLGLHPILRLPDSPGAARLELPGCREVWPLPSDSGTSVLDNSAPFPDPTQAPRADGGTIDLTRLPLTERVDEILLVADPDEPTIGLVNEEEGYRVGVEWDPEHLSSALLWISNRGRQGEPWAGRNVCLGVEPITSAFDFGEGVSAADNPLAAAGVRTTVDLRAGERYEIRHRITGRSLR